MNVSGRIKKNLITRIRETEDPDLLKEIETIFVSKSEEVIELFAAIEIGSDQIKKQIQNSSAGNERIKITNIRIRIRVNPFPSKKN